MPAGKLQCLHNAGRQMLRAFEPEGGFNDLPGWDFASMAAGMGGDGCVLHTCAELHAVLARFVKAVKRLSMPG